MDDGEEANAALDPGFFDGRIMVEIDRWDWCFRVGLADELTSPEERFPGGLRYARRFEIDGRIRAPAELRGKSIRILLSPFGPEVRFGEGGLDRVGEIQPADAPPWDYAATVLFPEASLPVLATCLASVWKYLDLEGRVISPVGHEGRRLQAWLSRTPVGLDLQEAGVVRQRSDEELQASLTAPESAFLRLTAVGDLAEGAKVIEFSLSRV